MEAEIAEGNRLIAEFMGAEFKKIDYYENGNIVEEIIFKEHPSQLIKGTGRTFTNLLGLRYQESFDWLMSVVKKIRDLNTIISIRYNRKTNTVTTQISSFLKNWIRDIYINNVDILSTWLAVVEFIKWYNLNK